MRNSRTAHRYEPKPNRCKPSKRRQSRKQKVIKKKKGREEGDQDRRAFSILARNLRVESVMADFTFPLKTQAGVTGLGGVTNVLHCIGKTAIKIYGFSGGIRPGVGLQGGIRATSRLQ